MSIFFRFQGDLVSFFRRVFIKEVAKKRSSPALLVQLNLSNSFYLSSKVEELSFDKLTKLAESLFSLEPGTKEFTNYHNSLDLARVDPNEICIFLVVSYKEDSICQLALNLDETRFLEICNIALQRIQKIKLCEKNATTI
jgi:hypothetical protein